MSHPVNPGRVAKTAENDNLMFILRFIGGVILDVLALVGLLLLPEETEEHGKDHDTHGHE